MADYPGMSPSMENAMPEADWNHGHEDGKGATRQGIQAAIKKPEKNPKEMDSPFTSSKEPALPTP